MCAIEVVTEQADKRYLEFLQKQNIPLSCMRKR